MTKLAIFLLFAAGAQAVDEGSAWTRAKTVYVAARSGFMREAEFERALLQDASWNQWGLTVTRAQADADLILEVRRKPFTSSFTLSVVDRRTQRVLASDRSNSIGGHIEPKLARDFVKMLKAHR